MKCSWCEKRTTNDNKKRDGMCAKCYKLYKNIGKNIDKYAQ